jgi:hypothetical protein
VSKWWIPTTSDDDLSEKDLTTLIVDLAKQLGWKRYHTYRSEKSPAGFPDEVFVRERVIFAELKRQKGKTTPLQDEWLDALRKAGSEVYLWRPSDLPEIAKILARRITRQPEQTAVGSSNESAIPAALEEAKERL